MPDPDKTSCFDLDQAALASAPIRRQACLVEVSGDEVGRILTLTRSLYVVGREEDCDLRIESEGVSRSHCRLERVAAGYEITDLSSTNGTFVNGFQVQTHALKEGDKLALGPKAVFVFRLCDLSEAVALSTLFEGVAKDSLTGLHNQQHLLEWLEGQLKLGQERGFDMALLAIGADGEEHLEADLAPPKKDGLVLEVANILKSLKPESSVLSRPGSLVFLLPVAYTRMSDVKKVTERVRQGLSRVTPVPSRTGEPRGVTFSLGQVTTREQARPHAEGLVEEAYRRLNLARRLGSGSLAQ